MCFGSNKVHELRYSLIIEKWRLQLLQSDAAQSSIATLDKTSNNESITTQTQEIISSMSDVLGALQIGVLCRSLPQSLCL